MKRRLPVTFPPVTGELLSSWINRHAAFYAVPPLVMLRHCLPGASSLRATDLELTTHQTIHLAGLFSTEPIILQRMTFGNVTHAARKFIAARPTQHCTNCNQGGPELTPILRSQLLGWRITCPRCGSQFNDSDRGEHPSPFQKYRVAALRGEKLLDDEIEHGTQSWASPLELARLLLMRRIPWPLPRADELWRFRILGAIIPDLDDVIAKESECLPTPARPILPLHIRTALLAGVAIVERAGPGMLNMLRGHMMGENQVRFTAAFDRLMAQDDRSKTLFQMQLI